MKYAIIENEYFALENLKQTIATLRPNYELVFTSDSVEETTHFFINNGQVDLVFMDIELVDGNCFEIFDKVNVQAPIIFTTAYDEFALRAFKVNSIDYLLKPLSALDVKQAIEKHERNSHRQVMPNWNFVQELVKGRETSSQRVLTVCGDSYSYVNMDDIAGFVSEDKCIFAYQKGGGRKMTEMQNLAEVEELVDSENFFRLSRDMIVNISSVEAVHEFFHARLSVTVMLGGEQHKVVVVSTARKKDFLDWMGGRRACK